jgi:hypothetical protein
VRTRTVDSELDSEGPLFAVLALNPEQWRQTPQTGTPCTMSWPMVRAWLSRPSWGDAKDVAGAWSPAKYKGNVRRKSAIEHVSMLVVDVDEAGDVDRVAGELAGYRAVVHETFSSSPEGPRCRVVLPLAAPVDATTYERTHAVVRAHLHAIGIEADDGAKDASRASYVPVRRPGTGYRFRVCDGRPLDASAVLAAQPVAPRRSEFRPVLPENRDRYIRGALCRAAEDVARASAGGRHHELSRQAWSLARLGLDEHEIMSALLPAWVVAAGDSRRREGERTIFDACKARRGAAA